jgi:DNA-binding response OmpR family regulator
LNDALSHAGFTPVVRRSMQEALDKIRHEEFVGIVVERDWVDVDVLEFVLNVRDYDAGTRILVVGRRGEARTDAALEAMDRTFNVGKVEGPDHLTRELLEVVSAQTPRGQ